jgi:benzoylformate decarboxylase
LTALSVAAALAAVMPPGAVFCDETVSKRQPFVNLLGFESPGSNVSGKGGGLGWSMPCALGLALGQPERPVVNVIGDGAFLYYPQTLWSAARLGLGSVVFAVLNNASYRVLKIGVERMGGPWSAGGAYPPGLDIFWARRGHCCRGAGDGVEAERVEALAELRPALERAFAAGKPYVVECVVDGAV